MPLSARFVALTFAIMLAAIPAWASAEEKSQTALIGVLGPMTIHRGSNTRDAVQFAVDRINQQGLQINGSHVTLKLFLVDDKNDLNLALLGAHAAVAAGVIGVIGHLTTDTSIAAARVYHDADIAQLAPTAAGRELTQLGYGNVFQLLGHSAYTGRYLADTALGILHAKRIILIDNDTVLGRELASNFQAAVVRQGGNIVATDKIGAKSSDFNAVIEKIRSSQADLIFFAGVAPQSDALAVRLKQVGLDTQLLLAGGAINVNFPLQSEDYPDGTLILVGGNPVEKAPDFKRMEKAYHEKYSSPLLPHTWFAYDAVGLLVAAMKKANSLNPQLLPPALHQLQFNGMSGKIAFAADGSLENPPYTLYRAEHGHWKTLRSVP